MVVYSRCFHPLNTMRSKHMSKQTGKQKGVRPSGLTLPLSAWAGMTRSPSLPISLLSGPIPAQGISDTLLFSAHLHCPTRSQCQEAGMSPSLSLQSCAASPALLCAVLYQAVAMETQFWNQWATAQVTCSPPNATKTPNTPQILQYLYENNVIFNHSELNSPKIQRQWDSCTLNLPTPACGFVFQPQLSPCPKRKHPSSFSTDGALTAQQEIQSSFLMPALGRGIAHIRPNRATLPFWLQLFTNTFRCHSSHFL